MKQNRPDRVETDRLILMQTRPEFASIINSTICENYEILHNWLQSFGAKNPPNVEKTLQDINEILFPVWEKEQGFFPSLFLRSTGSHIGICGAYRDVNCLNDNLNLRENDENNKSLIPLEKAMELSYWLDKDCWGQGLMHEALTALIEYIRIYFGDVAYLIIQPHDHNIRSKRVAERLGFELKTKYWKRYEKRPDWDMQKLPDAVYVLKL